jgi:hypothetical protein
MDFKTKKIEMLKKVFSITAIGFLFFTVAEILSLFHIVINLAIIKFMNFGFSFFLGAHFIMYIVFYLIKYDEK